MSTDDLELPCMEALKTIHPGQPPELMKPIYAYLGALRKEIAELRTTAEVNAKVHERIAKRCARLGIEKQDWKEAMNAKNDALLLVAQENKDLRNKLAGLISG